MRSHPKEQKPSLLKVGEVAEQVGVTLRTVRYYQSLGLIEANRRSRGGVHLYGHEACDRIRFIRDLRSLNIPLATIRRMIEERRLAGTGADGARGIVASLSHGLAEIDKRMQQYLGVRRELTEALEVLATCLRCERTPFKMICLACENLAGRERLPVYVRGLVG